MTYTKEQATEGISKLITDYEQLKKRKTARKERLEDIGEANVRADFIDPLFEMLGWNVRNPDEYDRENYVRGAGFVDIALKLSDRSGITAEDKAKVFIEAKRFGGVPNLTDRTFQKTLFGKTIYADWTEEERQILNYASKTLDVKWAILTNFEKFRLFNARTGVTVLNIEKPKELLERIDELLFLTKDSIETDRIDILETRIERPDVDIEFLDLMNTWRLKIAKSIYENNRNKTFEIKDEKIALSFNSEEERKKSLELIKEATQRILDRLIIVKYAEDKFVIDPEQLEEANRYWKRTSYASLFVVLNDFFRGFWGIHDSKIFEPEHICEKVKVNDKVLSDIIDGICGMNFRKFTSDILGNTYESYLGHELYFNEREELNIRPNQQLKKSGGIYYTPSYVVNYIVENTLGIKLEEIWNDVEKLLDKGEYKEGYNRFKDVSKIKVLDPACGSGSFLVKAFNLIKEYYERYNKKIEDIQQIKNEEFVENEGNQLNLEEERFLTKISKREKQILKENIYAVDLDPSACEIASVNLVLSALKREEELPLILDENIKVGNSLISGSTKDLKAYFEDVEKESPFNWEEEFKDVFLDGGFDVVIGNPPYISFGLGRTGKLSIKEERYYREVYSNSAEYKISTYALFMGRGIDLLSNNGRFGFILPDSFLTGSYFSKIRRKILDTCKIKVITLFTKDFWKAGDVGFPVILILEKEKDRDLRDANYLTTQVCKTPDLFVVGEIKSTTYQQSYFQVTPRNRFRLWFNENEMNIIKKMERNSLPLNAVISLHQGIRSKVGREKIVSKIKQGDTWKKGLISSGEISRYWLGYEGNYINVEPTLLFKGGWKKESIEQEKLLIRRTGDSLIATLDEVGYYHTNALIYTIKKDTTDADVDYEKKFMLALFNSTLLNFYYKKITMKEGRTLPQIEIDTLEYLPIPKVSQEEQKPFIDLVTQIISLNKQKRSLFFLFRDLSNKFDQNRLLRPFSKYCTIERTLSLEDYTEEEVERRYSTSNYTMNIVKSIELIKHEEEGRVEKVKCDIDEEYLVLKVKIKGEADFRTMLKVYFEDALIKEFFVLSIKSYLEENSRKRCWNKEKIWEVLDEIKIPRSVQNLDADVRNIKQLMRTFEEAYTEKLSEEFKESPVKVLNLTKIEEEIEKTDNQIDQKVYELYGLTKEEIEIIEKSL